LPPSSTVPDKVNLVNHALGTRHSFHHFASKVHNVGGKKFVNQPHDSSTSLRLPSQDLDLLHSVRIPVKALRLVAKIFDDLQVFLEAGTAIGKSAVRRVERPEQRCIERC
jgi:hypothetical protein